MQEKYYMKKWELSAIILNLSTYKIFTGYSRIFAETSGPSAALTAAFSGGIAFLILWFLINLYDKTGGKTIIALAEEKIGRFAKYIIFALLFAYLIYSAAITLRETGEFIKSVSFPTAPLIFIFIFIAVGAIICCAQGFDAIGRTHSIIIPISVAATVIIAVFAIPNGEISNLSPYLGYGSYNAFIKGLSSIGLYGDLIILFMLAPFADKQTDFKRTALCASAAGIGINILVILAYTLSAPYTVSDTIIHPFYQLIKLFSAGRFFQRIDGYFMYIAALCAILTLALNIFFAGYAAKETFNLPKIRPLSYPIGAVITFFALIHKSRESLYSAAKHTLWIWAAVVFSLTAIVLIVSKLKRRKSQ